MQDRLKYRFWHKPTNKMLYCYGFNKDFVFGDTFDGVGTTYNPAKFEDCILMQCTGLKDKNGKLIYEGDILKAYFENSDTGKMCFEYVPVGYDEEKIAFYTGKKYKALFAEGYFISEEYEIVGNIYENPELLENNK